MAQTTDPGSRTRGEASASNGSTNGANGTSSGGAQRGFSLSALFGPRQAAGANGRPQRASNGMGTFLKGWLLLVVGMYVLQIVLYLVDANFFHGWLETHYIAGTNGGTKPGSAFILGGMSWYLLIFVALFAGLYYALVKFKILPKDLFGQRSTQAQTNARTASNGSRNNAAVSNAAPPPLPSGVNPYANHTRAARREAQRRAAVAAATAAAQPKRGLFGRSKPQSSVATSSAAMVTTKKSAHVVESDSAANPGDSQYQRVRAEQRQRKRRAAKR